MSQGNNVIRRSVSTNTVDQNMDSLDSPPKEMKTNSHVTSCAPMNQSTDLRGFRARIGRVPLLRLQALAAEIQ